MFYVSSSITSALKPLEPEAVESQLRERKKDAPLKSKDRPKSQHPDDRDLVPTEETMSVLSVKALILFLEDFIEAHLGMEQQEDTQAAATHFQPWMRIEHSNINHPAPSVQAANAYSHVAQAVKKNEKTQGDKRPSKTPKLASVYALLHDLRQMQSDNVQFLKIKNDLPFIESVLLAVQEKKAQSQL